MQRVLACRRPGVLSGGKNSMPLLYVILATSHRFVVRLVFGENSDSTDGHESFHWADLQILSPMLLM
jgi:hypothetical protein